MTSALLFGAVLSQPPRSPHRRGLAVAVGCMGAAGLAYRGAAMLARHEHNLSQPEVPT